MINFRFYFSIILFFFIHFVFGQPGELDPSFGDNGIVITDFNTINENFTSLEIQPDQKIIAIGWVYGLGRFIASRYDIDGSLDPTFGDNGLFTAFPPEIVVCGASSLQKDGKIIMGGTAPIFIVPTKTDEEDLILMRLNPYGKIDSTFGVDGILITDLGGHFERIEEILIQSDGKILVAGEGSDNIQGAFFYLVRYETNGLLDSAFGDQGIKKVYEVFTVQNMVLQSDSKIIVGGFGDIGITADFDLRRFESDGGIDVSFGNGGKVITDFSGKRDYIFSINVEPDERIFVSGGTDVTGETSKLAFARYYPDGSLDNSYGINGIETISLPPYSLVNDMARQPDGKYVLCGTSNHLDGEYHVLLIRINHDGGLDESFGDQGVVYTVKPESYSGAEGLVVQNNNYIVLGGVSQESGSGIDFTLSRYIVDDVVGTKDQKLNILSLQASPNPCNDYFYVETEKAYDQYQCQIIDMSGRLLIDRRIGANETGRLEINVWNLSPGVYFGIFNNKLKQIRTKIVIQN